LLLKNKSIFFYIYFSIKNNINYISKNYVLTLKTTGLIFLRNILLICILDTFLIDEEPLWEPLEWTLVQTWVLFIFIFSWIAETVVSSKYGSFTGRDKRVYFGLYRGFWIAQLWIIFNLFITLVFIIVPFYFEIYYNISYVVTWWNWFNSLFFFKIIFLFTFLNIITMISRFGLRWLNWKKILILNLIVTIVLFYLFFTQLVLTYFCYNTDILQYKKSGWMDYSSLSHGPLKWGWGSFGRDFFSFHGTLESYWFKNDSMYSLSFFLISFFLIFLYLFLIIQNLVFIRKLYYNKEISYTFLTYNSSNINQFFFSLLYLLGLVVISVLYQYMRSPGEFFLFDSNLSWSKIYLSNITYYFFFFFK